MLIAEVLAEDYCPGVKVDWYARVIVYTSPNGLLTHPDAVFHSVVEVGRKQDLEMARKEAKKNAGY